MFGVSYPLTEGQLRYEVAQILEIWGLEKWLVLEMIDPFSLLFKFKAAK